MEKIKTFPLKFTATYLDELGSCAASVKMTKEEFILNAIEKEKNKIEGEK